MTSKHLSTSDFHFTNRNLWHFYSPRGNCDFKSFANKLEEILTEVKLDCLMEEWGVGVSKSMQT